MKTQAMIIHLQRAAARRARVAALQDMLPLPSHVIDAVDGQQLTEPQAQSYARRLMRPSYPFVLRPSEVAVFHSHRRCWQRIIAQNLDAALILEDDLRLDPEVFPRALSLALNHLRPGDFVRLPIKDRGTPVKEVASDGEMRLQTYDRVGLGMVAQIVTRDAAQALLAASEQFDRPVDDFLQMQWLHGVRVLTVWPTGVQEISSELGGSMIGRKSGRIEKLWREVLRPIYRFKMARRAAQYLGTQPRG